MKGSRDKRRIRRMITFAMLRGAATTAGGLIVTGALWWFQRR